MEMHWFAFTASIIAALILGGIIGIKLASIAMRGLIRDGRMREIVDDERIRRLENTAAELDRKLSAAEKMAGIK